MIPLKWYLSNTLHHMFTIFLLIKSNMKTVIIPSVSHSILLLLPMLNYISIGNHERVSGTPCKDFADLSCSLVVAATSRALRPSGTDISTGGRSLE